MCGLTPCPYAKWYRCHPACGPKSAKCRVRACVEARKGAGPSAAATPQQPEEMSSSHESDSEYCNLYHYYLHYAHRSHARTRASGLTDGATLNFTRRVPVKKALLNEFSRDVRPTAVCRQEQPSREAGIMSSIHSHSPLVTKKNRIIISFHRELSVL